MTCLDSIACGHCPRCVGALHSEIASLRSSLSAAEKELADLRKQVAILDANQIVRTIHKHADGECGGVQFVYADGRTRGCAMEFDDVAEMYAKASYEAQEMLRTVEAERDALRSELASLKAPADRFDPTEICDPISGVHSGKTLPGECICDELRTAYARGAQDHGAEIERLRERERILQRVRETADAVANYIEEAHPVNEGEAGDGIYLCQEVRGDDDRVCALYEALNEADALLSPAPAPSPSPVDSLTGEAQAVCAICGGKGKHKRSRECVDCPKCNYPSMGTLDLCSFDGVLTVTKICDMCAPKPVEAEPMTRDEVLQALASAAPGAREIHEQMKNVFAPPDNSVRLDSAKQPVEAEQPKELTRAVAIAPMVAFGGEQPKPAAECERCNGLGDVSVPAGCGCCDTRETCGDCEGTGKKRGEEGR